MKKKQTQQTLTIIIQGILGPEYQVAYLTRQKCRDRNIDITLTGWRIIHHCQTLNWRLGDNSTEAFTNLGRYIGLKEASEAVNCLWGNTNK